jgi:OOP family OmpA-OmpF porin
MTLRASHRLLNVLPALLLALNLGTAVAQAPSASASANAAAAPMPAAGASASRLVIRSHTLPAQGLFEGDRLSAAARARLDAMLAEASDLDVEVALLVPAGPWRLDGQPGDERSLTPARLAALRQHLVQRGLPAKRIYVESRIEPSATAPRLVIELVGRPSPQ